MANKEENVKDHNITIELMLAGVNMFLALTQAHFIPSRRQGLK